MHEFGLTDCGESNGSLGVGVLDPRRSEIEYLNQAMARKREQLRRERDQQGRWAIQQQIRTLGEDLQRLLANDSPPLGFVRAANLHNYLGAVPPTGWRAIVKKK